MRRVILTFMLCAVLGAGVIWALGGFDQLARWAANLQRQSQNAMADALRALHAGQPGAIWALWGVAFTYGVAHAAGPGHGKMLIGAYGAGQRVALQRLSLIALLSSLAQATTAVVLVYAGVGLFALTRAQVEGVAATWLDPLSYAVVGGLGLWLIWRGARRWYQAARVGGVAGHVRQHHTHHDHGAHHHGHIPHHPAEPAQSADTHAHHGAPCASCGHRHGPDLAEVSALRGWRDAALLIGAIAIRPCTGALFLLILTWRMGLEWAGIAGAYAMGLGTALITVLVAALAVWGREGALLWTGRLAGAARLMPVAEVLAGAVVVAIATQMLLTLR